MVGIIGSLVAVEPLARQLGSRPFRTIVNLRSTVSFEIPIAFPAMAALTLTLVLNPVVRQPDPATPAAALDHVPAALRVRPVFNEYSFGGYLIFRDVKPLIDGRTDMYGGVFLKQYVDAAQGNGKVLWDVFHKYDVAWSLMPPANAVVAVLDASPDWQRLYADDTAVVQVRKDVATSLGLP